MDIRDSPMQSDVLSFFTPATGNFNSSHCNSNALKFDIFEPAASKSKTITVKCEKPTEQMLATPELNATESYTDSNGCYRLERLDSSVNPDITAKLDRMAQKLGFQVSTRNGDWANHNTNSDCDDLQLDDCDLNGFGAPTEPASSRDHMVSATPTTENSVPKRSLFATLIKRFSSRPKTPAPAVDDSSREKHVVRSRATSADTRPRRIRRWFTKRLWRQKAPESKEAAEQSEASMASAGAVLEGVFTDALDTSVPPQNHHVLQHRPSKTPHDCPVSQSIHSGPPRDFVSLEHLSSFAAPHLNTHLAEVATVRVYPTEPATAGPYTKSSRSQFEIPSRSNALVSGTSEKALTLPYPQNGQSGRSRPMPAVSFSQNSLLRGHSIRSTGSGGGGGDADDRSLGHGSFLSRQACGSEANVLLRQGNRSPGLDESGLPSRYTPSYVSVSVAAFGYSGYGRTSFSASSLLQNAKTDRPKGLSLSHGPSIHSRIRGCATDSAKPDADQPGSNRGPLHVEISESNNGAAGPVLANGTSGSPTKSGDQKPPSDAKPADSPRTPSRPTSKLSQSPCASPNADVSESNSSSVVRLRRSRTRSHTGQSDDQEHWHRSSLIMLAVAHASPRGRLAIAGAGPESETEDAQPDLGPHQSGSLRIMNGTHLGALADGMYASLTQSYHESIREETDAGSIPTPTETATPTQTASVGPVSTVRDSTAPELETTVDGRYFLRIADQVQTELLIQIDRTEADLQSSVLDEECAGLLRTAVGKAKLLLSEKFAQFRSLCKQNLDWEAARSGAGGERCTERPDLVTLVSDLDGFWAMVMLQVDDVRSMFAQVQQARDNGWKLTSVADGAASGPAVTSANGDSRDVNGATATRPTATTKKQATASGRRHASGSKPAAPTRDDTAARAKARERLATAKRELRAKRMEAAANTRPNAASGAGEDMFLVV